jgi:hypothetical protein
VTLFVYYNGADQGNTSVRLGALGLTSAADSTVSFGSVIFDDPAGSRTITGWKTLNVDEPECVGSSRLFTGYVADRRYTRGPYRTDTSRWIDTTIVDQNAVLGLRLITGSDGKRPAETHIERIDWLLGSAYLSGLIVDDGLVYRGNPRPFGEADYRGQYPYDVLNDISAPIFQTFFAVYSQTTHRVGLFFNQPNATTNTSTLTISNVETDVSRDVNGVVTGTCYPPSVDAEMMRDPSEVYSTVRMTHKYGTVLATRASTATNFISRGLQVNNDRIGQASALVMSESLLDRSADEWDKITVKIQLPPSKVGLIDAGMRVGVRFAHIPGFETLTYSRVTQRNIAQAEGSDQLYDVSLELSTHGLSPGGGGAGGFPFQGACSVVPAQAVTEEDLVSSTVQIDISAPTPGRILVAYVAGRGTITGTPGCTDNGTGSWTEHTNSPQTPAGGGDVILRAYHKVAVGNETVVTIASGGSGNKSAGVVYEIPAAAIAERTTNNAGAGPYGSSQVFTGTLSTSRGIEIIGTVFNADDISHDYNATVVAPVVEVADGTIDNNFNPGYFFGYAQDVASISGTWNHGNNWASLNYGIDCDAQDAPIQGQWFYDIVPTPAADGTTVTFTLPTGYEFADGSLLVKVDRLDQTAAITSYDGAARTFTLGFAPKVGELIEVTGQSR